MVRTRGRVGPSGVTNVDHVALIRPQPATYTRADDGWRQSPDVVPFAWEVVCAECGDDGGPAELQPEDARALRGPYLTRDEGLRVAIRHRM
jgi:hypothetical protein